MKKALTIFVCILLLVLLSACQIHIDTDPWPASQEYAEATASPAEDLPQPVSFVTPAEQDETAITVSPIPQPTPTLPPTPVEPGFNG
ncbi:MAG: hypothetical protein E7319_03940 [Clostridiales bacterium]|nr:hypothetical protein [Clostridiales bacterium]